MRRLVPASLVVCAALLASCGGSSSDKPQARTSTIAPEVAPAPSSPLGLPAGIPLKPTGPADPADAKVIQAWSAALRAGEIAAAADQWAAQATVQNGTPVLRLPNRQHVMIFNDAFPCGSVVTATGAANGYTITTFRLTARKGASGGCAGSIGAKARCAILVRDGKIAEWYRLPTDPDAPRAVPAPDDIDSQTV